MARSYEIGDIVRTVFGAKFLEQVLVWFAALHFFGATWPAAVIIAAGVGTAYIAGGLSALGHHLSHHGKSCGCK